jgi:plastocyanin
MPTSRLRRAVQLAAVLMVTGLVVLATWPRPAVDIRIAASGIASMHGRFGRVSALPETIVVAAGGRPRVRITNADSIEHRLGLFAAPASESVEYTLPQPGTYTGLCSAHPTSETLTFVVR